MNCLFCYGIEKNIDEKVDIKRKNFKRSKSQEEPYSKVEYSVLRGEAFGREETSERPHSGVYTDKCWGVNPMGSGSIVWKTPSGQGVRGSWKKVSEGPAQGVVIGNDTRRCMVGVWCRDGKRLAYIEAGFLSAVQRGWIADIYHNVHPLCFSGSAECKLVNGSWANQAMNWLEVSLRWEVLEVPGGGLQERRSKPRLVGFFDKSRNWFAF